MARLIDARRHTARREVILQEAYRQFAVAGYDRTSTASICKGAGISSGTFFHYFPTKLEVLVGILAAGLAGTREALAEIEARCGGLSAVIAYGEHLLEEMSDAYFAGFVHAVAGVERLPEVATVLEGESMLVREFLARHLTQAAERREIRSDVDLERLATWTQWLLDGAAQSASTSPPDDLVDALRAFLARSRR